MGMTNYNPLKNAASTAQSYLNKIFGPNQNTQSPQAMTNSLPAQTTLPGYNYNPYQVQSGDTFKAIADKNQMTESQIQAANNGMLVPPPKGSFINLPVYGPPAQLSQTHPNPTTNPLLSINPPVGQLPQNMTVRSRDDLQAMITSIQNSPDAPNLVPAQALTHLVNPQTGQPWTPQEMQSNGYTYNEATANWIKGTTPAQQNATLTGGGGGGGGSSDFNNTGFMQRYNALGTPFLQQKRWDSTTHKFVSIGKLIKQGKLDLHGYTHRGKHRGGGGGQPPPQESRANPGGSGGPSTVLDLHLGSG